MLHPAISTARHRILTSSTPDLPGESAPLYIRAQIFPDVAVESLYWLPSGTDLSENDNDPKATWREHTRHLASLWIR
jgi:hypothetical protein